MLRRNTAFLKLAIAMIGITALILSIFWLPGFVTSRAAEYPDYISLKYPVLVVVYTTSIPFTLLFINLTSCSNISNENMLFPISL